VESFDTGDDEPGTSGRSVYMLFFYIGLITAVPSLIIGVQAAEMVTKCYDEKDACLVSCVELWEQRLASMRNSDERHSISGMGAGVEACQLGCEDDFAQCLEPGWLMIVSVLFLLFGAFCTCCIAGFTKRLKDSAVENERKKKLGMDPLAAVEKPKAEKKPKGVDEDSDMDDGPGEDTEAAKLADMLKEQVKYGDPVVCPDCNQQFRCRGLDGPKTILCPYCHHVVSGILPYGIAPPRHLEVHEPSTELALPL